MIGEINLSKFTFLDLSPDMIKIAKECYPLPYAEFVVGQAQQMEYREEYDAVTAIQVNHYLSREERAVVTRKCFDALRGKGVFITFENFAPYTEYGKDLYLRRWGDYQRENGKDKEEVRQHIRRYGTKYFPITISEHLQLLKSCGFRKNEVLWVSYMQVGLLAIK